MFSTEPNATPSDKVATLIVEAYDWMGPGTLNEPDWMPERGTSDQAA